jgi:hypothetical protein
VVGDAFLELARSLARHLTAHTYHTYLPPTHARLPAPYQNAMCVRSRVTRFVARWTPIGRHHQAVVCVCSSLVHHTP